MTDPFTRDELAQADREGRVTWPICGECGQRFKQWTVDNDAEAVYPTEELWPGGPVVEATWLMPERMRVTNVRITSACGHEQALEALSIRVRAR